MASIINSKRLLIVLILISVVAIINFPPNAGTEVKHNDTVTDNSTVPQLFLQFVVFMFLISGLSYYHIMKYQIEPLSESEYYVIAFILVGVALRMWSYYELGRYFTYTIKTEQDHKLINTGPYKYLVHPSYTGQVLAILGTVYILTRSWVFTAGLLGVSSFIVSKRINVEEDVMRQKFGDKYKKYLKTRSRLIPFVY
jgi:protein-S-isoprenylcysteine O-methyltransferase Ste14